MPATSSSSDYILQDRFLGFSCPQVGIDEAFLELVATMHAHQIISLFLDRYAAELKKRGDGLIGLLENWLQGETDFETVWDPVFGDAYRAVQVADAYKAQNVAAAVALRLSACGMVGEWDLMLQTLPARLRWDRWLLPAADSIAVRSNGKAVCISTRLGSSQQEINFTRTSDGWEAYDIDRLVTFGTQRNRIIFLRPEALTMAQFQDLPTPVAESIERGIVAACEEAVALLRNHASTYLRWVERILRYIILLRHGKEHVSGSAEGGWGLIHTSACCHSLLFAETLVHEASHQYLYLLCRLGRVDDGTDANLYYSPIVQAHRPLNRIVLAYHAFANVLLLYRLFRTSGLEDDGYLARNEASLVPQLNQLESALRKNSALTPIGLALCDPLIERIH